jgi:hypothetical protein
MLEPGIGPHSAVATVFPHQHGNRTIAFRLRQHAAIELHARADKRCKDQRLAKNLAQLVGIGMTMQDR